MPLLYFCHGRPCLALPAKQFCILILTIGLFLRAESPYHAGVGSGKPCCENSLRIACASHQWPLYDDLRRKLWRARYDHSSSPGASALCHPRNRQLRQEPLSQGAFLLPSILRFSYHPFCSLSLWAAKMFLLKKDTLDSTTASPSALTTNLQRSGVTS